MNSFGKREAEGADAPSEAHAALGGGFGRSGLVGNRNSRRVSRGTSASSNRLAVFLLPRRSLLCPLLTSSARSHAGQGQGHGWWFASALTEKGLRI